MILNNFAMTLFSKENKHVLVPIYYLDKEAITFSYVSPTYTLESIDANIIGEKVLNVARYVDSLDPSVFSSVELDDRLVPGILGYTSWAKVKKHTYCVWINRKESGNDSNIVTICPYHPVGKGYQYTLKDENTIEYANINNPKEIGQSVVNALKVFN